MTITPDPFPALLAEDRRSGLERRAGFIDAVLFGGLVAAQVDAERAYLDALRCRAGVWTTVRELDGIAEGLARAVGIVGGVEPAVVRAAAADQVSSEDPDAIEQARARARAALPASSTGNPVRS